jgi:hypothetical protein
MRIVLSEDGNTRHEYESELGDSFLLFNEWALVNCSQEELAILADPVMSDAKSDIMMKWHLDQKINAHRCFVNDVLQ